MSTTSNPFEAIQTSIAELKLQNEQLIDLVKNSGSFSNQAKPVSEWMNAEELRAYLPGRPKLGTIYQWTHKSLIPFHKQNGKALLFRKDQIDSWIASGMQFDPKNEGAL